MLKYVDNFVKFEELVAYVSNLYTVLNFQYAGSYSLLSTLLQLYVTYSYNDILVRCI